MIANERFLPYFRLTQNNLQSANNRTACAVEPVSKPVNERFRLYLGKDTFNQLKISFKVLKIE